MDTSTESVIDHSLTEAALRRSRSVENAIAVERKVQAVYDAALFPMAERYTFRLGVVRTEAIGLPTVLLLGNHSSGKSSFINHVFGKEIQKTGVAPVDDGFTLIMHGDEETDLDGRTVVTHPYLPYRGFEQFGPAFLSHLKLKIRSSDVLRSLVLIDSPGMIDSPTQSRTRGYDFTGVVRHFAENADLIVFFFDPDKPGTTSESLSAFTEALSGVAHKMLIVMNKVDLFPNIRDFARAYGALCWNLAHVIKTKDLPHIYCTFIDTGTMQQAVKPSGLPLEDFQQSCDEVIAEINRAPERRSDNLVSTLYDSARRLQVHARVSSALGSQYWVWKTKAWLVTIAILSMSGIASWFQYKQNESFDLPVVLFSLIGLTLTVGSIRIGAMVVNKLFNTAITGLDLFFQREYEHELTMQNDKADLEALWESVKPGVIEFMKKTSGHKVPLRMFNRLVFEKLDKAILQEIPALRRDVLGADN